MYPLFAEIDIGGMIALAIGVLGVAGVIFTALRYNRDDTTAVVQQQNTILGDMKLLNDELRTTADGLRSERDSLAIQVRELSEQVERLRRSA
jgi:Tfp pilus assembly protein PilV